MEEKKKVESKVIVNIKPANLMTLPIVIEGTTPYVQHHFHNKAALMLGMQQDKAEKKNAKANRAKRDYEAEYKAATHVDTSGKYGMPAAAFRKAAISACRLFRYPMTMAKLSIFVIADSYDADGTPLIHISGKPVMRTDHVRNDNGSIDIRARPMWNVGWRATVHVRFDGDQFTASDIANLFERIGEQVGIGEGRHDSKESSGMGWGCFKIVKVGGSNR